MDREAVSERLAKFFSTNRSDLGKFGSTVNQTFEAFVFTQVISWYRGRNWKVVLEPPKGSPAGTVKLKFNTRGRPSGYTYARCEKDDVVVQIRHGLRVATRHHKRFQFPPANVCLDVSVIQDRDLLDYDTDAYLPNDDLITFAEAKHMSAFAELVANFIGLVHEMQPNRLAEGSMRQPRPGRRRRHPAPFLYVSGILYKTARGVVETIPR
jgi:hypothetical protein